MHESVISISSLIEICQTKAIASGFKKGHQRTLEPYHVEWHPKLSHFEENLHPNLSHPNRLSCLIFEEGWANCDARSRFFQSNVSEHSYFGVCSRTN